MMLIINNWVNGLPDIDAELAEASPRAGSGRLSRQKDIIVVTYDVDGSPHKVTEGLVINWRPAN